MDTMNNTGEDRRALSALLISRGYTIRNLATGPRRALNHSRVVLDADGVQVFEGTAQEVRAWLDSEVKVCETCGASGRVPGYTRGSNWAWVPCGDCEPQGYVYLPGL